MRVETIMNLYLLEGTKLFSICVQNPEGTTILKLLTLKLKNKNFEASTALLLAT